MAWTTEINTNDIVARRDKRLFKLGMTWFAALVVMLFFGTQIITFNMPFYGDMIAPQSVDPHGWFTPMFISMFVLYMAMALGFIGWKKYKHNGVVTDREFNTLRLTGYTILTASVGIYVLAPILYGTFIKFLLGPGLTIGAIPTWYTLMWPTLFIVFLIVIPLAGVLMVYTNDTHKPWWLKVDEHTYVRTRNWLLSMFTVYMFLAPLIISGQGIWMLDATGVYKYNWQSNMFFGVYVLSTLGFTGLYAYSMLSKKDWGKVFKKSTKTKDIFWTTVVAMTTFSFALWWTDQFIINHIYTIGVASLGTRIDPNTVLHTLEDGTEITVGFVNNVVLPLINTINPSDIYMGVNDPYYITTFILAIAVPITFMMIPAYYYAAINEETKLITAENFDKLRDWRFRNKD